MAPVVSAALRCPKTGEYSVAADVIRIVTSCPPSNMSWQYCDALLAYQNPAPHEAGSTTPQASRLQRGGVLRTSWALKANAAPRRHPRATPELGRGRGKSTVGPSQEKRKKAGPKWSRWCMQVSNSGSSAIYPMSCDWVRSLKLSSIAHQQDRCRSSVTSCTDMQPRPTSESFE